MLTLQEIESVLDKWRERLWLQAWRISIDPDPVELENEGATMEIVRSPDYLRAEIRLGDGWRDWSRDAFGPAGADQFRRRTTLDEAVCHELVHLVLHDLHRSGRLEYGFLTRDVDRLHEDELNHHLERAVDQVAAILLRAYGEV